MGCRSSLVPPPAIRSGSKRPCRSAWSDLTVNDPISLRPALAAVPRRSPARRSIDAEYGNTVALLAPRPGPIAQLHPQIKPAPEAVAKKTVPFRRRTAAPTLWYIRGRSSESRLARARRGNPAHRRLWNSGRLLRRSIGGDAARPRIAGIWRADANRW